MDNELLKALVQINASILSIIQEKSELEKALEEKEDTDYPRIVPYPS